MLKLFFHPDSNKRELTDATAEYKRIWKKEGRRMIAATEKISNLRFAEKFLHAIVFEGTTSSHPLRFRASYPEQIKCGAIVHELCHRLLTGNGIQSKEKNSTKWALEVHKRTNLILYDIWVNLYGNEFANKHVCTESGRRPYYRKAWKWALSLTQKQRARKFAKLVAQARREHKSGRQS